MSPKEIPNRSTSRDGSEQGQKVEQKEIENSPEDLLLYVKYLQRKAYGDRNNARTKAQWEHYQKRYKKMENVLDALKAYVGSGYADTMSELSRVIDEDYDDPNIDADDLDTLNDLREIVDKRSSDGDVYKDKQFVEWLENSGIRGGEVDTNQKTEPERADTEQAGTEQAVDAVQLTKMEADQVLKLDIPVENMFDALSILSRIDLTKRFPHFLKITEQTFADKQVYERMVQFIKDTLHWILKEHQEGDLDSDYIEDIITKPFENYLDKMLPELLATSLRERAGISFTKLHTSVKNLAQEIRRQGHDFHPDELSLRIIVLNTKDEDIKNTHDSLLQSIDTTRKSFEDLNEQIAGLDAQEL